MCELITQIADFDKVDLGNELGIYTSISRYSESHGRTHYDDGRA
jgi:hypothetical protein